MMLPVTVTFHGMSPSEWIEHEIRERVAKLDRYCRRIISCHVVFDIPHRHHEADNRFSLRIVLHVPDDEIAVTHASRFEIDGLRKDVRVVVRKAFDVARRRLQDYARKHRLAVKPHARRPRAAA